MWRTGGGTRLGAFCPPPDAARLEPGQIQPFGLQSTCLAFLAICQKLLHPTLAPDGWGRVKRFLNNGLGNLA